MTGIRYFTLFLVLICPLVSSEAEVLDRVVATIGAEPVTLLEIKDILRKKSGSEGNGKLSETDIKEAILVLLFNREASKLGVSITEEDISEYIKRVEVANGGEPGSIVKAITAQGLTLESYREKIKLELERSRILAMNVRTQVQVSDEEVSKYLGAEDKENNKEGGFYLVNLVYSDVKLPADKLVSYIKDNKKCFTSAEFNAECINMGEVQVEDLKEDLKALVEDLEPYEGSAELVVDGGLERSVYIRVDGKFGAESGETFLKIKEQIYQKKFMEKANEFVSKEIFEKYGVEIY